MRNAISCLVADSDPEAIREIETLCRKTGMVEVRWTATSAASGAEIVRNRRPDVAIIGLDGSPPAAIELISGLSREFPDVYLIALSARNDADLILQAMRAGAHDFLRKPARESDIRGAADKVSRLKSARHGPSAAQGMIVSVFGNKGGNGTTTISVNLADAVARDHGKRTVVVDLVLSHGDVTMFFNVSPTYSIMDLAKNAEKADREFLHSLLVRHPSGVYILADPPSIEEADRISAAQVRDVLAALRSMFDVVIVDTPHTFDERTLTALEMSDVVLLVAMLNLPSLRSAQRCLDLFGRIGLRDERVRLVLSRYLPDGEIPKERVEKVLKCPVSFSVPNDYPTVIASINRGKPLRDIAPDKEITRSFRRLAGLVLGEGAPAAEAAPGKAAPGKASATKAGGILGRIFGLERSLK